MKILFYGKCQCITKINHPCKGFSFTTFLTPLCQSRKQMAMFKCPKASKKKENKKRKPNSKTLPFPFLPSPLFTNQSQNFLTLPRINAPSLRPFVSLLFVHPLLAFFLPFFTKKMPALGTSFLVAFIGMRLSEGGK